jgi:uncharacterized protein
MEASLHPAAPAIRHSAWIQTASGIAFDLCNPQPEAVNFKIDVAEPLGRLARFVGQTQSGIYSVAQHCVIGADQLFHETGNPKLAAAFLLHDAHEAYLGDIASPVSAALAAYVGACGEADAKRRGIDADAGKRAARWSCEAGLSYLKQSVDAAVFAAADIDFPLSTEAQVEVKHMDLRMLATERKHLLSRSPLPWSEAVEKAEPLRIRGRIGLWPWPMAADAWLDRLSRYAPRARLFPTQPNISATRRGRAA